MHHPLNSMVPTCATFSAFRRSLLFSRVQNAYPRHQVTSRSASVGSCKGTQLHAQAGGQVRRSSPGVWQVQAQQSMASQQCTGPGR